MSPLLLAKDANGHDMQGFAVAADHKYAIKLAAGTKNTFTIPISSDGNTGTGNPVSVLVTTDAYSWLAIGATLAVPAGNVVDGSAPLLLAPGVPRVVVIPVSTTQISIISTAGGFALCEWHDH